MATIDVAQLVLDMLIIGVVVNRLIDIFVGLSFAFYLNMRGSLSPRQIASVIAAFGFEFLPGLDAIPFWTLDAVFIMLTDKAMNKVAESSKVGRVATKSFKVLAKTTDTLTSIKRAPAGATPPVIHPPAPHGAVPPIIGGAGSSAGSAAGAAAHSVTTRSGIPRLNIPREELLKEAGKEYLKDEAKERTMEGIKRKYKEAALLDSFDEENAEKQNGSEQEGEEAEAGGDESEQQEDES